MKVSVVKRLRSLNACIYHGMLRQCRQTAWPRGQQAAEDVAGLSLSLFGRCCDPAAALSTTLGQGRSNSQVLHTKCAEVSGAELLVISV